MAFRLLSGHEVLFFRTTSLSRSVINREHHWISVRPQREKYQKKSFSGSDRKEKATSDFNPLGRKAFVAFIL